MCCAKCIESIIGYNRNTKLYRIKHHIRCTGKKCTVIRKGNQSADGKRLVFQRQRITNLQIVVICIHTVNCNFRVCRRKCPVHQANLVDFFPVLENPERTVYFLGVIFQIIIWIDGNVFIVLDGF